MKKLLLLGLLPFASMAQTVPATSTLASGTTFANAASAANVSTAQAVIANAQNSSRFTFGVASDGGITTNTAAKFAGAEVQVAGKISKAATAAAIGRFAVKAGSAFGVIGVGVAIYDLAKELGFTMTKGTTGAIEFSKDGVKGTDCGTSPGSASPLQQCNASWAGPCHAEMTPFVANQIPQQRCNAVSNYYGSVYMEIYDWKYVTSPSKPSTVEEFAAEIGNKTLWVPSSAIARSIKDAIANGEAPLSVPTTVTGPATTPGTTSTKTDQAANTTTTTTTVNNFTYEGANITTGATTTTTTTNNVDNTVINKTVDTATKPITATEPTPDPCDANPTRAGCTKLGDVPTSEELPRKSVPVTSSVISFAAPSGCPAPISFPVYGKSYAISYNGLCDALGPIRLIFLAFGAALAAVIFMEGLKS